MTFKHSISSSIRIHAIVLAALTWGTIQSEAQSLSFNQVRLVTASETVPTGKVWKIESVGSNSAQNLSMPSACSTLFNSTQIVVNGTTLHVSARYVYNASNCASSASGGAAIGSTGDLTQLPFWLPAGATLAPGTGTGMISVLEFNVNP